MWAEVTPERWNDWRWQARNAVRDVAGLRQVLCLGREEEEEIARSLDRFQMSITPYYATLMDPVDPRDPIRLQAVAQGAEALEGRYEMADPLAEDANSPVPGLTHRYPDRVLFLLTDRCPLYCRHCTRRRLVGQPEETLPGHHVEAGLDYIEHHPEIRDVLLSGGDAFLLSDQRLEEILARLRQIPHVEIIRFGTRTPVVLPQRITPQLAGMIARYHPVYVNTHFNHPRELTPEAVAACGRLADAGVPLGNQTVLLRGINDCPVVIRSLVHGLLKARVRPYYLYQCDLSQGLEHFRTPISRGIEIIEMLRGHTSGMAVPTFVVDAPDGGGKIPVMPNYIVSMAPGKLILRNYQGRLCTYNEPVGGEDRTGGGVCSTCGTDHSGMAAQGVGTLFYDRSLTLDPVAPAPKGDSAPHRVLDSPTPIT